MTGQQRPIEAGDPGGSGAGVEQRLDPVQLRGIEGRLRLEDRVLEERSLLVRRDGRVDVLRREKRSFSASVR